METPLQELAASEVCSALRSLADTVEENPELALTQVVDKAETAALRAQTMLSAALALGTPLTLSEDVAT